MTRYVVDASVAAKWFLPEEHADAAARLRDPAHDLIAPELLVVEVANTMLKRSRTGQVELVDAEIFVAGVPDIVSLVPSRELTSPALEIALKHGRTIYDALYVALGMRESCAVVTADRRLYNALQPAFGDALLWVADLPGSG